MTKKRVNRDISECFDTNSFCLSAKILKKEDILIDVASFYFSQGKKIKNMFYRKIFDRQNLDDKTLIAKFAL